MEKKRSLKLLIVSACLALLLVSIGGIIAGANEPVATDDNLVISGASFDLNDKISIAFAVKASTIGYTEGSTALDYYVYSYGTNPGTSAGEGTKLTSFVTRTIGGEQYVFFFTDGIAAPDYKDTVYVRLGNADGTVFGPVHKTGVLEMANRQLASSKAKLAAATTDEDKDYYNTRVKLYSAIVNYGTNADLVISEETEYDYSFISVTDGYIVDEEGGKWTSGVYKNGTKLNLVAGADYNIKYYTVQGVEVAWTDGTTSSTDSTFVVDGDATIMPELRKVSTAAPSSSDEWYLTGSAGAYGWNALSSLLKANTDSAFTLSGTNTAAASKAITRSAALDENGNMIVTYEYNHKTFDIDGKYTDEGARAYLAENKADVFGSSGYGLQENHQYFYFSNSATGKTFDISYDIFFPGTDKNGNGERYDAGVWVESIQTTTTTTTTDEETGDIITTETPTTVYKTHNGDMYVTDTGRAMLRIPIRIKPSGSSSSVLMYVELVGVGSNGKITGFYITTYGSGTVGTGLTDCSDKVFDITEWHTISYRITPGDDGTIDKLEVIVDDQVVATHLKDNGEGPLGFDTDAAAIPLVGDTKAENVNFGIQSYGRFNGDLQLKNLHSDYSYTLTADEVKALATYNATATNYTENAYVTSYTASGRTHHAWNSLATLAGADKLGTYAASAANVANGSWYYDASTDSVVYSKKNSTNASTSNAGLFTMLLENPLYNQTWEAGTTLVFEYTMRLGAVDPDGDRTMSEWAEISGKSTMVGGFMTLGYGDGAGAAVVNADTSKGFMVNTISATNSVFAGYRFNNGKQTSNHSFGMSYRSYNGDTGATTIATQYFGGVAVTYRYELDIDENGVPATLRVYADGVLKTTRYNTADSSGKTNITHYDGIDTAQTLTADIFAAPYIEISCFPDQYMVCTMIFSNMRAWSQTSN